MPTVSRLTVTPVKGLAMLDRDEVHLEGCGIAENRRFYLTDPLGVLVSVVDAPQLVQIRAEYDPRLELLRLELPDGTAVEGSALELGEAVETKFSGRLVRGRVIGGPFADALSSHAGRTLQLVRPDRTGEAFDVKPLTLLSDASVEELERQSGRATPLDERRFRIQIHLSGCRPHEEDTWDGKRLRLGDAVVRVGGPIPRCRATTRNPDRGEKDFDTLKAIAAYRGRRAGRHVDFGVYAEVETPGLVRVGDPVQLV